MKNLDNLNLKELSFEEQINTDGGADGDFASQVGHIAKHVWKHRGSGVMLALSLYFCNDY